MKRFRIIRLKFRNLASYGDRGNELRFDEVIYPLFVSGSNGAGKTTFFVDALTFALFTSAYGVKNAHNLILRAGRARPGQVELEFMVGDERYTVVRWFNGSTWIHLLYKYRGDGSRILVAEGAAPVRNKIRGLIGLDYDTFLSSIVIREGEVYEFIEVKPAERRDLIIRLLAIPFERFKEHARGMMERYRRELERIKGRIDELRGRIRYSEDEIHRRIDQLSRRRDDIAREINNYNNKLDMLRDNLSKLAESIGKIKELERELEDREYRLNMIKRRILQINEKIVGMDPDQLRGILELSEKWVELMNERSNMEATIRQLEEERRKYVEIDRLEKWIDATRHRLMDLIEEFKVEEGMEPSGERLESIKMEISEKKENIKILNEYIDVLMPVKEPFCPICGSKLSDKDREDLIKRFKREIDELTRAISSLEDKRAKLENILRVINGMENEIGIMENRISLLRETITMDRLKLESELARYREELNKLNREMEEHRGAISRALGLRDKDITGIALKILENREEILEYNRLRMEVREYRERIRRRDYDRLRIEMEEMEGEIKRLTRERDRLIDESRRIEVELENLNQQLEDIKRLKDYHVEERRIEEEYRDWNILYEKVFLDSRFPLAYIRDITETILTDYVNSILREIYPDSHITLKASRTGIDLEVYIGNVRRDPKTISRGEKTLIGFAIRLALARLVANLHGLIRPEILVIDEGFGALDEDNREEVARVISRLIDTGEFKQVIVMSHQSDLKDMPIFNTHIRVVNDGYSRLELA